MALVDNKAFRRGFPAFLLILAAAAAYGAVAYQTLFYGHLGAEEAAALIRSWWYTSGAVAPYTATDATGAMPAYFYQLGYWQQLVGLGQFWGRVMSIGLGVINGILLFAICKRLTANATAAAAAVFVFLATPATAFAFATATPAAMVSALHLGAIFLLVTGLGRPRIWATVVLALLLAALFFYRQSMILSVIALAPLYVAAIGRQRAVHALILVVVLAAVSAGVFYGFPDKLAHYALRLPVVYPFLADAGVLPPNFTLIDHGTTAPYTLAFALDRISIRAIYDSFLLPYSGTLLLALMLLAVVGGPLKILWAAPLYFLWLAVTHYLGSIGFCSRCMTSYTPYFIGVGALAASLTFAMMARWARQSGSSPGLVVLGAAVVAVAMNTFAPSLAFDPAAKNYPEPLISDTGAREQTDTETLARWIASHAPGDEPILVLHSLGTQKIPALPYAVFLAGHMMPPQSLNLAQTKRVIGPKISADAREAVQAAIEEETLWSDGTLARWITRDYELILLQDDPSLDQTNLRAAIAAQFDQTATTTYRGANLLLFKRKPAQ